MKLIVFLVLLCLLSILSPLVAEVRSLYVTSTTNDPTDTVHNNRDCLTPETACSFVRAAEIHEEDDEFVVVGELHCSRLQTYINLFHLHEGTIRGYDENAVFVGTSSSVHICIITLVQPGEDSHFTWHFYNLRFRDHNVQHPIAVGTIIPHYDYVHCTIENSTVLPGHVFGLTVTNTTIINSIFTPKIGGILQTKPLRWRKIRMEGLTVLGSQVGARMRTNEIGPRPYELIISGSTFVNNSQLRVLGFTGKWSGNDVTTTLSVTDTIFENNILSDDTDLVEIADMTEAVFTRVKFRNNRAHVSCISFEETSTSLAFTKVYTVVNSTFEKNTGLDSCLVFSGSYASKVLGSIFHQNVILDDGFFEKGSGAIKYKDDSKSADFIFPVAPHFGSMVQESVFDGNTGWFAGAIHVEGYVRLVIDRCRFTNNLSRAASALYVLSYYTAIVSSLFENNRVLSDVMMGSQAYHVGVVTILGGQTAIINSTITHSNQHGIFTSDARTLQLAQIIVSHTQTGLYVDDLSMQSKIFVGGRWDDIWILGLFPYLLGHIPTNDHNVFSFNNASGIIVNSFHQAHFHNVTLLENQNDMGGGMQLFFDRPRQKMVLQSVHMHGNRATLYGGGMYMNFSGTPGEITIQHDVLIHHNQAKVGGGLFIGIEQVSCSLFFTADVSDNHADYGDGIFWQKRVIKDVPGQFPSNDLQNSAPERMVIVPTRHVTLSDDSAQKKKHDVSYCEHFRGAGLHARKYSCVVFLHIFDTFNNSIMSDHLPNRLHSYLEPDISASPFVSFESPLFFKVADSSVPDRFSSGMAPTLWNLTFDLFVQNDAAFTHDVGRSRMGLDISVLLKTTEDIKRKYVIPLALPNCPGQVVSNGLCVSFMSVYWAAIIFPVIFSMAVGFACVVAVLVSCSICVSAALKMRSSRLERKNQFYRSLDDDIKMLLLEREENENGPRISINKKLFEIPFDEIKISKKLGSGGSGAVVFKANWKGVEAAFKVFRTSSFNDSGFYDAFEKEVSILSSCRHPGIIGFYGCTLKDNKIGILMELCGNGSLKQYLETMKELEEVAFTFEDKLRILLDIAKCMSYLHRVQVVHRDLKADNVLLDDNLRPRLIDFGLSKVLENQSNNTIRIGTRGSMAPELIRGSVYSNKVDVYSFAILMYQLLTEQLDVYGNQENIEVRVATDPNFRPVVDAEAIPNIEAMQWFLDLMRECWKDNPDQRPEFEDIVHILEEHLARKSW